MPVASSTVTLWEATPAAPRQLDQTKSGDDGRFRVRTDGARSDGVLYLVAAGGVPKASKARRDSPAAAQELGDARPDTAGIVRVDLGECAPSARCTMDPSLKGLLARPADRETPAREIFEALGMKLHHIWYSAQGEIVCVAEGGAVNGASVAMVVTASGGLCNASVEELLTTKQRFEAMKAAGEVAAKYRAPGASVTSPT